MTDLERNMFNAACGCNPDRLRDALMAGADINQPNGQGLLPLRLIQAAAARSGAGWLLYSWMTVRPIRTMKSLINYNQLSWPNVNSGLI